MYQQQSWILTPGILLVPLYIYSIHAVQIDIDFIRHHEALTFCLASSSKLYIYKLYIWGMNRSWIKIFFSSTLDFCRKWKVFTKESSPKHLSLRMPLSIPMSPMSNTVPSPDVHIHTSGFDPHVVQKTYRTMYMTIFRSVCHCFLR